MGLKRRYGGETEAGVARRKAKEALRRLEGAREFDVEALLPFEIVHRVWNRVLYNSPDLWKTLDLSHRQTLGGEKFITTDPTSPKNTTATLQTLLHKTPQRFTHLTRLDVSCTFFDPTFVLTPHVESMLGGSLMALSLNGCPLVTSGSLYYLRGLRKLRSLDLSHCEGVDDMGLEVLARFLPWVQSLNLSYLFKVTDGGVKRLFKMAGLTSVNLMGCCRIKSYPWAVSNDHPRSTLPIKEISIGEDSRIQTRGFWLLWCTWQQWDMGKVVRVCPFLEKLEALDLTVHIGVTGEMFETLIVAGALKRLKALKFHSKHTNVFGGERLGMFVKAVGSRLE
ncbi:hypothetical protein HDU67_007003 [Dinochytrium kinnereticum]|nr:hypothetical protein HDU67_007003 [Dinochytrium kinnereticum]